ncbi:MAG TPA: type II secretion system protein GspH [Deltaproteobacteria bacterium]|nr:type II secretion system protein GspH [Deltaproteobacteria bacterium]
MSLAPGIRTPGGFSLLELIVVLVIIGVVSAFVGPKLAGSMTNMNLRTASKRVAALLRYARNQAVSFGTDSVVHFDFEKNRISLTSLKPPSDGPEADSEEGPDGTAEHGRRPETYLLPDGVYLKEGVLGEEETDSGIFEITFLPDGGSSGGEVILMNQRERGYIIAVDFITGVVRVGRHET